jgi:hypothetical protein
MTRHRKIQLVGLALIATLWQPKQAHAATNICFVCAHAFFCPGETERAAACDAECGQGSGWFTFCVSDTDGCTGWEDTKWECWY